MYFWLVKLNLFHPIQSGLTSIIDGVISNLSWKHADFYFAVFEFCSVLWNQTEDHVAWFLFVCIRNMDSGKWDRIDWKAKNWEKSVGSL